jgi:hypothetical protein
MRDVNPSDESSTPEWPWIIDCDSAYETWTLRSELDQLSRRRRWVRLAVGVVAVLVMLCISLAVSADARRTACRAPGLRSLCAATGIGNVPTDEERARWEQALAMNSGESLRRYLQAYPMGAYADEARARLAGCSHVRIETLGAERDVRYPLTVNANRTRLQTSERDARTDAVARGNQDAATSCALLASSAKVLSAATEPRDWRCVEDGHRFACGFDGEIVCRVRDRIASDEERCGEAAAGVGRSR